MLRSSLASALLLTLSLAACKNQTPDAVSGEPVKVAADAPPHAAPTTPEAAAAEAAPPTPEAATPAASKYSEAGFDLVIQPKGGAYATGQAGEAEILLSAKAPFHVNDKYPYKFKLKEAPGIKYANLVVAKDAVKLEHTKATVPVAFTPESAGKHTVAGTLSFSVCTDDKCMIEKRDLALDIEAK